MKKIYSFLTIAAMLSSVTPVLAGGHRHSSSSDITVINSSEACVSNSVNVSASTGSNTANGGEGDEGGNGGSAERNRNSGSTQTNTGGDGGNGGDGALGGLINTGDADASANVSNDVNKNKTTIAACGDCGSRTGDIVVINTNRARVSNSVGVNADTGNNVANGGEGDEGGKGGSTDSNINSGNSNHHRGHHGSNGGTQTNAGGDGGNGGDGGVGGDIYTGSSTASADVVNVINRNITRIRR